MATIIDALVLTLGIDSSDFRKKSVEINDTTKKTRDNLVKRQKEIDESTKRTTESFSNLRDSVLEVFAVFLAGRGLKEFVSDVTTTTAAIGRLSRQFDMGVQDLGAWRGAAQLTGGTADDITGSIGGLVNDLEQLGLGTVPQSVLYLRAFNQELLHTGQRGIDLGRIFDPQTGAIRPGGVTELLFELNRSIQGIDPARARALIQGLGLGQSAANLLSLRPEQLRAIYETAKQNAPTAADAKAMQDSQFAWYQTYQYSEAAGRSMLTQVTPALKQILGYAQEFFEYLKAHKDAAQRVFWGMAVAVGALTLAISGPLIGRALLPLIAALRVIISLLRGSLILDMAVLSEKSIPKLSAAFFKLGLAIEASKFLTIIAFLGRMAAAFYVAYQGATLLSDWLDNFSVGGVKLGLKFKDLFGGGQGAKPAAGTSNGDLLSYGSSPASGGGTGGASPQDAMRYFMSRGWTPEQSAAIVGNLKWESGLNPNSVGDNGTALGIAQWHRDRQNDFQSLFGHGLSASTIREQLDFVDKELRGKQRGAGNALSSAGDIASAVRAVMFGYERPASSASYAARLGLAEGLLRSSVAQNGGTSKSTTVNVNGPIAVNTQAKDAAGIASRLHGALERTSFAAQANYGPS